MPKLPTKPLTPAEIYVLQAILDGHATDRQIARALGIHWRTAGNQMRMLREKLDAPDRTQAVLTALRLGIVDLNPKR